MKQKKDSRRSARQCLRFEYFALYLLPLDKKTPAIRARMARIAELYKRWS